MNSKEIAAPVADEEPVRENQEKGVPVKNIFEAAEVEIVTVPGPLISVSSDDYVVNLSADSDYNEDSDSDDSLTSTACSLDPALKADVSDGSSSQRSNGMLLDLNEPYYEENIKTSTGLPDLNIKTSTGLPDLNNMVPRDDLKSSCGKVNPRLYQTHPGFVSYEQHQHHHQHHAFRTWPSAPDWVNPFYPYIGVNADLPSSRVYPIYVRDDEKHVYPMRQSPLYRASPFYPYMGVDTMPYSTNEAKPAKHIFSRSHIDFMGLKKDSVQPKSGNRVLELFGQSIPIPEAPILKTEMKRKDTTDCTSQLWSSNNKRTRLAL